MEDITLISVTYSKRWHLLKTVLEAARDQGVRRAFVIDNGFPLKDFKKRAAQAGLDHRKVNTVLLTHTHGDHIRGLESLLASTGALLVHRRGIRIEAVLRKLKHVPAMLVDANVSYDVAGVAFYPFDLSHDAPHATSYHFKAGGTRFTLITDTGRTDATMLKLAARSDVLFLEANYCPHLLEQGPYPPVLRERVAGDEVEYAIGLPGDGFETEVFFSDLSHGYVTINADYTT